MTYKDKKIEVGWGVRVKVPGTLYEIETEVIEVYDTHVIVKINGKDAQVPEAAVLGVIEPGTLALNQALDRENLKDN